MYHPSMDTKPVNQTVAWVCGTVIILAVLGGLFVLVWHGALAGVAVLGVVGTITAAVLGAIGAKSAITSSLVAANYVARKAPEDV